MIDAHRAVLETVVADHPNALLFVTVSGAHLYGFASADSDFDLRGVHLIAAPDLLGLGRGRETVTHSGVRKGREIDLVTHDARKFFRLMLKHNGYVLEQLFSPLIVKSTPEHGELKTLGVGCITRNHVRHYLGFARNQWELFRKECPPRVKPLLYVYRVICTGLHLMRTGEVEANLLRLNEEFRLPQVADLIAAKSAGAEQQRLDDAALGFHEREYERLMAELEAAGAASTLPQEPTARAGLDVLLIRLRRRTIREGCT